MISRSIDAGWELDDTFYVHDFCGHGYLHFKDMKFYVYGHKNDSFRGYLTKSDLISFNLGDGIYKFNNSDSDMMLFWKIKNGDFEKHGYLGKKEYGPIFTIYLDGLYDIIFSFASKVIKRKYRSYHDGQEIEIEAIFDFFGQSIDAIA